MPCGQLLRGGKPDDRLLPANLRYNNSAHQVNGKRKIMAEVVKLTFNPFQENTYLVHDDTGECLIIDPGCWNAEEQRELVRAVEERGLRPVRLLNTHCHLDHVFGNKFVASRWGLSLEIHRLELPVLQAVPQVATLYGLPPVEESPAPAHFLEEGETVAFGNTTLEILFTPGHSPGSVCFYDRSAGKLIAGDVLFQRSIGRTDLPGGDHSTLIGSILSRVMPLPDETVVYPGHGPNTTVGEERAENPFL